MSNPQIISALAASLLKKQRKAGIGASAGVTTGPQGVDAAATASHYATLSPAQKRRWAAAYGRKP